MQLTRDPGLAKEGFLTAKVKLIEIIKKKKGAVEGMGGSSRVCDTLSTNVQNDLVIQEINQVP